MAEFLINSGWNPNLAQIVASTLGAVVLASFGLVWVIFSIWLERKFAGRVQDRIGPNRTGPYGLFQTFADIGKLLTKEDITPEAPISTSTISRRFWRWRASSPFSP